MTDAANWDEKDLQELIDSEAEENVTREFKRSEALEDLTELRKTDISKDVSAFANRIGGTLIYGIEEDNSEPHQARALSPIDPRKCSKERLEQIINTRIKPQIPNLLINSVSLKAVEPGKFAYVVQIPASSTVHQAFDKRYYRRVNFGNAMMDDDEIRQAMNRQTKPTYSVRLITYETKKDQIWISGNVQNTSPMVGRDVSAILLIPARLSVRGVFSESEMINGIPHVRTLSTLRGRVVSQLSPFETMEILFENAVSVPGISFGSTQFTAYVRVYDQFGIAHNAEFDCSLLPPLGDIKAERQKSREVF
jgi:hypothetical protein